MNPPQDIQNKAETDINKALNEAQDYRKVCEKDATQASTNKRIGRWVNSIVGIVIAGFGFVVGSPNFTEWPDNIRFTIGLTNAIGGAMITVLGQRLDPVVSRERAINLRSLVLDLEGLERKINYKLELIKENNPSKEDYQNLSKEIYTDLNNYKRNAHKLGIKV